MIYFQSISAGFLFGFFFAIFSLPIPAPPCLAGVIGVFGVYLGYLVAMRFK